MKDITKTLYGMSDINVKDRDTIRNKAKDLEDRKIKSILDVLFWTGSISEKQAYAVAKFVELHAIPIRDFVDTIPDLVD
jgi:hypothetical protein